MQRNYIILPIILIQLIIVLMSPTEAKDADDYEYLIVTTDALKDLYGNFIEFNKRRCLRAKIQTIDYIKANMQGVDDADKLRNYIKQEFTDHNIVYVLLGGDVPTIPHREFRAQFYDNITTPDNYYDIKDIAADMYYSCLDGDWKGTNQYYGEPGSEDIGWEVYASRFAVDNETELNNMINKTIRYSEDPVDNEIKNALLTDDMVWSPDPPPPPFPLDELIGVCNANGYTTVGFTDTWDITKMYEWYDPVNASDIRDKITEEKITWINHVGHANNTYVLKHALSDVTNTNFTNNGTNANFFIIYTQSDYACNFTYNDCIAEQFTAGISNGAVGFIGKCGYTIGDDDGTDYAQQRLHRYFHDAIFDKGIHYLEMMNAYSKEVNADYIMEPDITQRPYLGTMKFVAYGLNVLGDPALSVWTETPQELQADHPTTLTSTKFIWDTKKPYTWIALLTEDGENIISTQLTDSTGKCEIEEETLTNYVLGNPNGKLKINVKAHNYLPYQGEIQIHNPEINESIVNVFKDNRIIFSGRTGTIEYYLTTSGIITISIYNSNGTLVKTIVKENQNTGKHTVTFKSDNVSNGIYYIKLTSGNNAVIRKTIVIK